MDRLTKIDGVGQVNYQKIDVMMPIRQTSMNGCGFWNAEESEEGQMYVYIRTEPNLWTVGFYDPTGRWHPDSDFGDPEEAAVRVSRLNGDASCDNGQECTPDENCSDDCMQKRVERLGRFEDFAETVLADPQRYGPYTVGEIRRILREDGPYD